MDFLLVLQAMGITLLVLALPILYKTWRLMINRNNYHKGKKGTLAPEPKGAWPIIGHLHLLAGKTPSFRTLAALADKHGPIFTIKLGVHRALVVSSKEAAAECFTVNDRAFLSRPQTATLKHMGYGGAMSVLGPHGDFWLELRKLISHQLLSNRCVESLKRVLASEVDLCIKELYSLCVKKGMGNDGTTATADMSRWFRLVTMNQMLRAIVGKRYGLGEDEEFGGAMDEFMRLAGALEISDVVPHVEWMDLQGNLKSMKRNAKEMDCLVSKWVEERVERIRISGRVKEEEEEEEGDFMDVLLSLFPGDGVLYGHKNKDIVKGTALSLIMAGSDTTTATLSWALSLLINHNEALEAAQKELNMYVGRERWVEESDINNLVYLQAVIKETLRLYPPGPLSIPRESIEDCHVGGYFVPKGTRLLVNQWKLHHDPSVWTDPDEFRPERFLSTHSKVDVRGQQFEYLPFSSGRRSCPGVTLALQMVHLTLGRILQGFHFATPMNAPLDMTEGLGLTLPRAAPLEISLSPRLPNKFYMG